MRQIKEISCLLLFFCYKNVSAQSTNSSNNSYLTINSFGNSDPVKPESVSFITDIPRDVRGFTRNSFTKKNIPAFIAIAFSTGIFYLADQSITNSIQHASSQMNVASRESFTPLINIKLGGKETNIGKIPRNFNTAFYDIGQGSTAMVLAGGFFLAGKISHDYRALQTAKQLTEAFIALGGITTIMKYATGRENPSEASMARGRWKPFPSVSDFQHNKPRYDAFPSGHLAVFTSAITIIGNNYPEKKWVKPVGYSIAAMCSLAMINNGVHWASDFPLGFALGHGFGNYLSHKPHHTVHIFF